MQKKRDELRSLNHFATLKSVHNLYGNLSYIRGDSKDYNFKDDLDQKRLFLTSMFFVFVLFWARLINSEKKIYIEPNFFLCNIENVHIYASVSYGNCRR